MDSVLLSMFFLLIVLLLALPVIFLLTPDPKLPPGKKGWPLVGETLEFLNTGLRGVPEKFVQDRIKKFSSQTFKTSLLGESVIVFGGPTGNKLLFSTESKLVSLWFPKCIDKIFPSSDPLSNHEESLKLRKMVSGFLKPEALQRYIGIMDSVTKQILESSCQNKKEVAIFPLAYKYTFTLACKVFLSLDDPIQLAKFAIPFHVMASGMLSMPINLPGTTFNKAINASKVIKKDLHEMIKKRKMDLAEKKASRTQDILSHLLVTSDQNGQFMSESDIADKVLGLLIGGHDTASSAITLIIKYLAELPHVYNEVFAEQIEILKSRKPGELLNMKDIQNMKYSWNVACEVLRLSPPAQGTFRQANTDFSYEGYTIPKGWKLYWSTYTTHKNPNYFTEPEKFDPTRFEGNGPAPYTYVPFGGGSRMCPGREYARFEMLVFMHNLVTKYKWEKMIPDEQIVFGPAPRPVKGLPVRLFPHAN